MGCSNLLNEKQGTYGIIKVACGRSSDGVYAPEVSTFVCSGLDINRARYAANNGLIFLDCAPATRAVVFAPELMVGAGCGVPTQANPSIPWFLSAPADRGPSE